MGVRGAPTQPKYHQDETRVTRIMNDTIVETHAQTMRQDIHETTAQLVRHLGVTAVSFLANAKDSKQAAKWAKSDGPEPREGAAKRLTAAHRVWSLISTAEDDYVARNWFLGNNPRLDENSPLEALREGQLKEVLAAAKAFSERTI